MVGKQTHIKGRWTENHTWHYTHTVELGCCWKLGSEQRVSSFQWQQVQGRRSYCVCEAAGPDDQMDPPPPPPPPLCINWHLWLSIQSHLERIPLESGFPINQSIHPSIYSSIHPFIHPILLNIFHNFVIQASLRQNLSVYMLIM
jgi:hypothetical protein